MSGSIFKILFSLFIVLVLTGNGSAQLSNSASQETDSLSRYIEMKYGLDQELINGFQYYNHHIQYKGDPYFPEDDFYKGSITLRGVTHDNVQLKYDCYSQHLILKYTDYKGGMNQLLLNNIHIDSFCLEANFFENLSLFDGEVRFYQVIDSGPVSCYIYWRKEIHSTIDDLTYSHEYGELNGIYYIRYMGEIYPVKNRKSIILIFPESLQPELKRYLRQEHFRFREAGPKEIQNLLNFISSLIETPPQH